MPIRSELNYLLQFVRPCKGIPHLRSKSWVLSVVILAFQSLLISNPFSLSPVRDVVLSIKSNLLLLSTNLRLICGIGFNYRFFYLIGYAFLFVTVNISFYHTSLSISLRYLHSFGLCFTFLLHQHFCFSHRFVSVLRSPSMHMPLIIPYSPVAYWRLCSLFGELRF